MAFDDDSKDFVYESALDEILTDEEAVFLDRLIENKGLLDTVLMHLPPDMETEIALAEDNAFVDTLIDEVESKSGRKLSDIERIELENDILSSLIDNFEEDDDISDNN